MKNKIILSVTAHPDDEVLGFGGAASLLSSHNDVFNCILSGKVNKRMLKPEQKILNDNILKSNHTLNCKIPIIGDFKNLEFNLVPHYKLVEFIEDVIIKIKPDYIFTHHPNDLNSDHFHVSKACQAACRLFQRRPGIKKISGLYYMEILSSTDWSFEVSDNFVPNTFIEIGKEHLDKKILALSQYKNVMRDYPHPRSEESLTSLALLRGSQSGLNYAEAFQCVFNII